LYGNDRKLSPLATISELEMHKNALMARAVTRTPLGNLQYSTELDFGKENVKGENR